MSESNQTERLARGIPPSAPPKPNDQPHALTFFFTSAQRRAVLRELGRGKRSRTEALLDRLKIERDHEDH